MTARFEDVQASYGRCTRQKGFITRFYELLLDSDGRIRALFESTNWTQQNKALRRGISIALTHAGGSNIVERPMSEMAELHSRKGGLPVDPELYGYWRESLLQAVDEFDPQINPTLKKNWSVALKKTTDHFVDKY
jgi:hemoglobin-like flavoprotein